MSAPAAVGRPSSRLDTERERADLHVRTLTGSLYAYIPLWAVGLGGLYWPLLLILSLAYLIHARLRGADLALVTVTGAVLVSVPIGLLRYPGEYDRVVGALGNGAVWLALAAGVHALRRVDGRVRLARALTWLGVVQGAVIGAAAALYPRPFPLPLSLPVNLPEGLSAFGNDHIFYEDWLGAAAFRSIGMMGNPTWSGAFGVVTAAAACLVFARGHRLLGTAGVLTSALAIALSLSRSTWIMAGIALLMVVFTGLRRSHPIALIAVSTVTALSALAVLLTARSALEGLVLSINNDREGSLDTRSDIYAATWKGITQLPIPLLGYGIKPSAPGLVASVATHSTYLGLLFRGGVIAVAAVVAALGMLWAESVRTRSLVGVFVCVFLLLWAVLEDLDGGHLACLGLLLAVAPTARAPADRTDPP